MVKSHSRKEIAYNYSLDKLTVLSVHDFKEMLLHQLWKVKFKIGTVKGLELQVFLTCVFSRRYCLQHTRVGCIWVVGVHVMSPNIARPLTLRTSPSDYATSNQIKPFLIFNIRLLLEREKNSKRFSLYVITAGQGWISAKIGKCCLKHSDLDFKCLRLQIIYFESSHWRSKLLRTTCCYFPWYIL